MMKVYWIKEQYSTKLAPLLRVVYDFFGPTPILFLLRSYFELIDFELEGMEFLYAFFFLPRHLVALGPHLHEMQHSRHRFFIPTLELLYCIMHRFRIEISHFFHPLFGITAFRLGQELPNLTVHQSISTLITEDRWLATKDCLPKSHSIIGPLRWKLSKIHICLGQQFNWGIVRLTVILEIVDPLFYISELILDCNLTYHAVSLPCMAIVDVLEIVSEGDFNFTLDHYPDVESYGGLMVARAVFSVGDSRE